MSKIVCDVCGTSYADTAAQCPICGCVRPGDGIVIDAEIQESEASKTDNYTHVKGGRFSRSNVKRRHIRTSAEGEDTAYAPAPTEDEPEVKSDKGLIVAVCMLLLAIVAVVIYIVVHFFGPQSDLGPKPEDPVVQPSTSATTESTELKVDCSEIVLSHTAIEIEVGQSQQLTVTVSPENTTDTVAFVSDNNTVATVSAEGIIQAVSAGETIITVTCGDIAEECTVVCIDPEETTAATGATDPTGVTESTDPTETTPDSTQPTQGGQNADGFVAPYRLNRHQADNPAERDVTIAVGESFQLKLLDANDKVITVDWTVGKKSICSVSGNTIKGKAPGTTTVSVEYEGVTYTCLVRVKEAS